MAYDTKDIRELEDIAEHLRQQIGLHPNYELEKLQLSECERWLQKRKRELLQQRPRTNA
ncbi:MAG: hypothetical protein ACR2IF_04750 [Terriglobales bacterium]